MKNKMWFFIIIFSFCGKINAQGIKSFDKYEIEKKDKAVAFAWYLVIPGGGIFYAEKRSQAALYFLANLATINWYLFSKNDPRHKTFPLIAVIGVRLIEISNTFAAVDDYNSKLRKKIWISAIPIHRGASIMLQYEF